jgi:hypothetical protein
MLAHFWQCPMCVGWWVGLALGLLGIGPAEGIGWPLLAKALADAFCSAGWCWVMHVVLVRLGAREL